MPRILIGYRRRRRPSAGPAAAPPLMTCAVIAAVVVSTVAGLSVARPVALRAQTAAVAAIAVTGYGDGHGRGMGQWGAYGYASSYGWDYQQILAHFYGGTVLGTLASPEPDITVHLSELDGHDTKALALNGGSLTATWAGAAQPLSAPAVQVARTRSGQTVYSGLSCGGPWRAVATTTSPVTIVSVSPSTSPPVGATEAEPELQVCLPGAGPRTYQGQIVAQPDGQTQDVLPLEDYVDGVVPAESPPVWASSGGEAALEAQAVAARSYALATTVVQGSVCDDAQCQMYTGLPDQYGLTADAAVAATAGEVLYCKAGSTCGPAGTVALTEYSSSTGGWTAGGAFPAVADAGDAVAANPVHIWTEDLAVSQLESQFPSIGTFVEVEVTQRNGLGQIGGRALQLTVQGSEGSVQLTGDQFAADFNLKSDWFEVRGAPLLVTTTSTTATPGLPGPPSVTSTTTGPSTPSSTPPTTGGGQTGVTTTVRGPTPSATAAASRSGYWVATRAGDVSAYGTAPLYGTAAGTSLAGSVTAMAPTHDHRGYWLAGSRGGVLAFGDAHWYGSASDLKLSAPIVGMAATPNGRGYWLVASDGGIFAYGDAHWYGSAGATPINRPIVGMAATPDGRGYWLVASDGGIFAYGDAVFYGSMGERRLYKPVTGIVPSSGGHGYALVARDGGVFAFGNAPFLGSLPSQRVRATVAAIAPTAGDKGYYVLATSGRVYAFGDAVLPLVTAADHGPGASGRAVAIAYYR